MPKQNRAGGNRDDFYAHPWLYAVEPFRVFGNLWFVGNSDGASYVVDTGDGLALFDTNFATASALYMHDLWLGGFDPRRVKLIFHTHGHHDHFGSTALLQALCGAKTVLGAEDAKMFRERPELALVKHAHAPLELFTPDIEVKDGDVLRLGSMTVRCAATPGHTPGATTYFITVNDGKKELTAALHGGAGLNTLEKRFIEEYGCADMRPAFLASIDKLMPEKADIFLGNHTFQNHTLEKLERRAAAPAGPDPFVDPGELQRFLAELRASYGAMLEREAAEG